MVTNFSQRRIVDKMHRHFVAVALNIWGDREVTWLDGRTMSEKALARALDVQFTPTLLFFDEKGNVVARLNGYYPPHKFEAVLDFVSGKQERRETLAAYMARRTPAPASAALADEPFFVKPPYVLTRAPGGKPLAVVFETPDCAACDEMHRDLFRRADVSAQLARFDVARFGLGARTEVTTPDGAKVKADAWARDLRIAYTPTVVLFDASGREVLRLDAYLRAFHFASALDYVASGAHRNEPSFQRYLAGPRGTAARRRRARRRLGVAAERKTGEAGGIRRRGCATAPCNARYRSSAALQHSSRSKFIVFPASTDSADAPDQPLWPSAATVTFLFTDIEGSTRLWETEQEAMKVALVRHDVLLRSAIQGNGGKIFKTGGDSFCAAFGTAAEGVAAAFAAQRALQAEPWPPTARIAVRMGAPQRHLRTPRRRLLRPDAEPRGAPDGRRPRRADARFRTDVHDVRRAPAAARHAEAAG